MQEWLLRQNVKCVTFLTKEDHLGGSVGSKVEAADIYQDTYLGYKPG